MSHSIADIATALGATAFGDTSITVTGLSEPGSATPDHLALAMSAKYGAALAQGRARAAVLAEGMDWQELGLEAAIYVPRPRYAMAGLTTALDAGPEIAAGIHPTAVIHDTAEIGAGAAIGPLVVIGPRTRIAPGARIAPQVTIAEDVVIGPDALIHSGTRIGARVVIGARVIIQPGAVIGGDGFSFVTPEKSRAEAARETLGGGDTAGIAPQSWTRIHSLGAVTIGDDVEIGSNACIDRGTIADTRIGDGSKVDNLVQVAHNVQIGRDCLICGSVGIAGSARIGDRVVLAGQVGVADNIEVGDDVVAGAASKILSSVPAGRMIMGYPAVKMDSHIEIYKAQRRLPRLMKTVAAMQKAVFNTDPKD